MPTYKFIKKTHID